MSIRSSFPRIAGVLTLAQLQALMAGLEEDDSRIGQRLTTRPSNHFPTAEVHRACALAYAGMRAEGMTTVAEVYEFFNVVCHKVEAASNLPELYSFMKAYDTLPRPLMMSEMRAAVGEEIAAREKFAA